jgi:signal peptidase I
MGIQFRLSTGTSMEPTYAAGASLLLVQKWGNEEPTDGQIVLARDPVYGNMCCKRISHTQTPGSYNILGDNKEESYDSRYFGPITKDHLHSKVLWHIVSLPEGISNIIDREFDRQSAVKYTKLGRTRVNAGG